MRAVRSLLALSVVTFADRLRKPWIHDCDATVRWHGADDHGWAGLHGGHGQMMMDMMADRMPPAPASQ